MMNGRRMVVKSTAGAALLLLGLSQAWAQDGSPASHRDDQGGHGPRRPPPEAYSACEGKSEGAECQVNFRERTIEGVCVAPQKDELFCMPNDMPQPPDGQRPPR